jgi:predicted DCC family thiol-disulfide oxidoreductase YuxK
VIYDGICALCSRSVAFIVRHDKRGRIRFTPLQSEWITLLRQRHPELASADSIIFVTHNVAWTESDAVIRISMELGGVWRLSGALLFIPRFLRDPLYRLVARHRYKLFGKRSECYLPDSMWSDRVLR